MRRGVRRFQSVRFNSLDSAIQQSRQCESRSVEWLVDCVESGTTNREPTLNVWNAALGRRGVQLSQRDRSSQRIPMLIAAALTVFMPMPPTLVAQFAPNPRRAAGFRLTVSQANAEDPGTDRCKVSGCSREVCANRTVATPCIWHSEFACYKNAVCAIQPAGKCGWTMTAKLNACLTTMKGSSGPPRASGTPPN